MKTNEYKFKVFPVKYVPGFVATFYQTIECAMRVRERMESQTGVEWRVRTINN